MQMAFSYSHNFSQLMVQSLLSAGYSKASIAEAADISKGTISRILNGQVKSPSHSIFSKLLKLYCRTLVR